MAKISKSLVPHGGWRFLQGSIWLKAATYSDLVSLVTSHRASNQIPSGNPEQDIQDQLAQANPQLQIDKPVSTKMVQVVNFAKSMFNYITSGGKLVDQGTANARATICKTCHNNQQPVDGKKGCCGKSSVEDAVLFGLRDKILGTKTTSNASSLNSCNICGCDIKLMVWFPLSTLGMNANNVNAYPSFCWKKQI